MYLRYAPMWTVWKKDCVYDRRTYQYAGPDQENAGRYPYQ